MNTRLENIRILLNEGFSDEELRDLAFDMPEFEPFYHELSQTTSKARIIEQLIEFANRKVLLDKLLDWAKKQNPTRYELHAPYTQRFTGEEIFHLPDTDKEDLIEFLRSTDDMESISNVDRAIALSSDVCVKKPSKRSRG